MIKTKENINSRKTPMEGMLKLPVKNLVLIIANADKSIVKAASNPTIGYTCFVLLVSELA